MKKTILAIANRVHSPLPGDTDSLAAHPFAAAFRSEAPLVGRETALALSTVPQLGSPPSAEAKADGQTAAQKRRSKAVASDPTTDADDAGKTPVPAKDGASLTSDEAVAAPYAWNPLSYAAPRAFWQHMENWSASGLDELVLLVDPEACAEDPLAWEPRLVETYIHAYGLGLVYLVQEAMRRFAERGGGTVLLVLCDKSLGLEGGEGGGLRAMAIGGLASLAESLLETALPSGCRFMAVRDESGQADLLARYVAKLLEEPPKDSGRLLRFTGRGGLFSRF